MANVACRAGLSDVECCIETYAKCGGLKKYFFENSKDLGLNFGGIMEVRGWGR